MGRLAIKLREVAAVKSSELDVLGDFQGSPLRSKSMRMLAMTLDYLFGCHHRHLSRVFTINGRTYRVCCDCGTEFDYSLETMSDLTHNVSVTLRRKERSNVVLEPAA